MNERYIVYILKSTIHGSYYVGCTTDIKKRLLEHNQGLSTYTSSKKPWQVIWYSVFFKKDEAFDKMDASFVARRAKKERWPSG